MALNCILCLGADVLICTCHSLALNYPVLETSMQPMGPAPVILHPLAVAAATFFTFSWDAVPGDWRVEHGPFG